MYQITMFETAEEAVDAFCRGIATGENDNRPAIPTSVYIVFDNDFESVYLSGEQSEYFRINPDISGSQMVEELAKKLGIRAVIT